MTRQNLFELIRKKQSFLCVGLDADIKKIPPHLLDSEDPFFEFNKQIIDSTNEFTVAYKPNLAFYESRGIKGWESLSKTIAYLNTFGNEIFTIADAKRGDIGNTSEQYARTFFENLDFDAVTVAPYMGRDSVSPFLKFNGKWVILLALTSNEGSFDFQMLQVNDANETKPLYQSVIKKSSQWGTLDSLMYVVGATRAEELAHIRKIIPDHFLLIPGVGAQGGSLTEVADYGLNSSCGLLVNSSRNIIYASNQEDFAQKARTEALSLQVQMKDLLKEHRLL